MRCTSRIEKQVLTRGRRQEQRWLRSTSKSRSKAGNSSADMDVSVVDQGYDGTDSLVGGDDEEEEPAVLVAPGTPVVIHLPNRCACW